MLWTALDKSLERLDDAEVSATPAQKLLSSTPRPETAPGIEQFKVQTHFYFLLLCNNALIKPRSFHDTLDGQTNR